MSGGMQNEFATCAMENQMGVAEIAFGKILGPELWCTASTANDFESGGFESGGFEPDSFEPDSAKTRMNLTYTDSRHS